MGSYEECCGTCISLKMHWASQTKQDSLQMCLHCSNQGRPLVYFGQTYTAILLQCHESDRKRKLSLFLFIVSILTLWFFAFFLLAQITFSQEQELPHFEKPMRKSFIAKKRWHGRIVVNEVVFFSAITPDCTVKCSLWTIKVYRTELTQDKVNYCICMYSVA